MRNQPRTGEALLALVEEGRLLYATPELARIACYTPAELNGPSFRFEYLFAPGDEPSLDPARATRASLQPLRGDAIPCLVTAVPLGPRMSAVLVHVGSDAPPAPPLAEVARALVNGLRSELGREVLALRRAQEAIARLEARPERLDLERLALAHDGLRALEEAREQVERRLSGLA